MQSHEVLERIVEAVIADVGRIDAREANAIRTPLAQLQRGSEGFVRACEAGHCDPERH